MTFLKNIIKRKFSTFFYFFKYLRLKMLLVILLSIVVSLLDGIGLAMFLPLLQMTGESGVVTPEKLGDLKFFGEILNNIGIALTLKAVILLLLIFFLLKGFFVYISTILNVYITQEFVSRLRIELTDFFSKLSFKKFISSNIGQVQNSFTEEISRISNALKAYTDCIQQIVMIIVYTILVFSIDWKFALFVSIGGLLTNLIFSSVLEKTKHRSKALTKNNSFYQGFLIQYITNFKYLKTTGSIYQYADKLKKTIKSIESDYKKIGFYGAIVSAAREPLLITVICIVILLQVTFLGSSLASIMVSLLFFYRALGALVLFQNSYNNFLSFSGSLENLSNFQQKLREGIEQNGNIDFVNFKESIIFDKVDFSYNNNYAILKNIDLTINKNQTIAFVGASGSGKTTLINMISGLLIPSQGEVLIDGIDINEFNKSSFQKKIGYISQDPVIFNDTIFNNITFWDTPSEENKLRFEKVIKQAAIADFIMDLTNKELTILGSNGINLSGGQKQRISIARELYKNIDILILDEATSALDTETERSIQENIDNLKGSCTILIIAHRLSTVKNVDTIYLMEKGKIIGNGSFDVLRMQSNQFNKMVELQEI